MIDSVGTSIFLRITSLVAMATMHFSHGQNRLLLGNILSAFRRVPGNNLALMKYCHIRSRGNRQGSLFSGYFPISLPFSHLSEKLRQQI